MYDNSPERSGTFEYSIGGLGAITAEYPQVCLARQQTVFNGETCGCFNAMGFPIRFKSKIHTHNSREEMHPSCTTGRLHIGVGKQGLPESTRTCNILVEHQATNLAYLIRESFAETTARAVLPETVMISSSKSHSWQTDSRPLTTGTKHKKCLQAIAKLWQDRPLISRIVCISD